MRVILLAALAFLSTCAYPGVEPFITTMSPGRDAVDVDAFTSITIELRSVLDETSFDADSVQVWSKETRLRGSVLVSTLTRETAHGELVPYTRIVLRPEQPLAAGLRYTCVVAASIRDISGEDLGQERRWTFVTRPPAWQNAARIALGAVADDTEVNIATWGNWGAMALWAGESGELHGSVFSDEAWHGVRTVTDAPRERRGAFALAVADPMSGAFAWVGKDDPGSRVWTRFVAADRWGSALPVSDAGVVFDELAYAISSYGDHLAVWCQATEQGAAVWAGLFDREEPPVPQKIAGDFPSGVHLLGAWFGGRQALVAYWVADGDHRGALWLASAVPGGGVWATTHLRDIEQGRVQQLRLASNGAGSALAIVWRQPGIEHVIHVQRWTEYWGWTSHEFPVPGGHSVSDEAPAITIDHAGVATIAGTGASGSWFARLTDSGVSAPRIIDPRLGPLALQVSQLGNVLLVGARDPEGDIVGTLLDPLDAFSVPRLITSSSGETRRLAVNLYVESRAIVVWVQGPRGATSLGASVYR